MKNSSPCPVCGKYSIEKIEQGSDIIKIKNEDIEVNANYYKCHQCNERFYSSSEKVNAIEAARNQYRIKYSMPTPEDIKNFMHKYNLSLRDMEKLTGIAFKTIDRYLRGAIPNHSNANLLRTFFHYPEVLFDIIKNSKLFPEKKIIKLINVLSNEIEAESILKCTAEFKEKIISLESDECLMKYNDREDPWEIIKESEEEIDDQEYKYAC